MAAAAGMGLGLLGTVGSTVSNVMASDVNAKAKQATARSIEAQAAFEETQVRRANRLLLGQANQAAAASGLDISSGSPLLLELDRVKQTEIEAQNIRRQGENAAATVRYDARMVRRQIPFQILTGVANSGSILTNYIQNRYWPDRPSSPRAPS